LAHKLGAYIQELDSLSPSYHQFADDKLSYGSGVSPRKHATAPRNVRRTRALVRNDGLGHTMQTQDVSSIQFSVLLSPVVGLHMNEVSKLGESIHDHPDGIKHVGRERQTHNEIHTNVFPFPGRDIKRLQQSGRSHTIGLDPLTCVTFCNISSSLMLH
jgi:hypothetical protein